MRRSIVPVLSLASLFGCAAPETLKSQPPTIAFDTPTKISVIRDCIFENNKAIASAPLGEDGWQLALEPHGGDVAEFYVQVRPNAQGGTHFEARIAEMPWKSATFEQAVRPCIENLPKLQATAP